MNTLGRLGLVLGFSLGFSTAARAQDFACELDADCPIGFACEVVGGSTSCDPSNDCTDVVDQEFRECRPQPLECETDGDCPTGLTCSLDLEECSIDASGQESCRGTQSYCSYSLTACTRDTDCTIANYACQDLGSAETCTLEEAPCQPGSDCSSPELIEVCETDGDPELSCFPRRIDCASDAGCPGGWLCAELPNDAQDDAPGEWAGATQVCMPEGIALAIRGAIELGDDESSRDTLGDGLGSTQDDGDGAPRESYGPSEGASASGCSVAHGSAGGGRSAFGVAWLVAAAWLVSARRRRMR